MRAVQTEIAKAQAKIEPTFVRYYHGTGAKLPVGAILYPGKTLGPEDNPQSQQVYICEVDEPETWWRQGVAAAEVVPIESALGAAATYAAMAAGVEAEEEDGFVDFADSDWSGFYVYQVEPIGPVIPDLHGEFAFDRTCDSARILGLVIDFSGRLGPKEPELLRQL